MDAIMLTVIVLSVVLMIRNGIVDRIRTRRLDEVSNAARKAMRVNDSKWDRFYDELFSVSYNHQLFDLTKWTFKQFYPEDPK